MGSTKGEDFQHSTNSLRIIRGISHLGHLTWEEVVSSVRMRTRLPLLWNGIFTLREEVQTH